MHPTPAHPFFLRRKDAKTYPRGSVLLDISSGTIKFQNLSKNGTLVPFLGAMTQNSVFIESKTLPFPHSHFVTLPLIYHETAVISLGKSAKPKKSFILTKNKPLRIALLFAKV